MLEPIVYIDHSDIREGKLPEVRARVHELVEFVGAQEPQLLAYGVFIDEEGGDMTEWSRFIRTLRPWSSIWR